MAEAAVKRGWTRVAFGDVVRLCKERSRDPEADGFERYVGLEHLEPGDLKIRRWGNVADGTTFTNVFRAGQILFGKRRAYQRKVGMADFSGVCSGDIYVFEPRNEHLLPDLLPFICQSEAFFQHAIGTSAGSLSPRTNWKSLTTYEFALPPLEEQRRITEVLKAANLFKEKFRDFHNCLIGILDSVAQHAMRSHTSVHLVAEYCDLNPQSLTKTQLSSDEVWEYADLSSVSFPLQLSSMRSIRLSEAPSRARRIAANGDILVSTVRPNLKGHALVSNQPSKIVASTGFAILRPKKATYKYIVAGLILSPHFLQHCEGRVTGTSYPAITPKDVSSFAIPDLLLLEQDGYGAVFELLLKGASEPWHMAHAAYLKFANTLSREIIVK